MDTNQSDLGDRLSSESEAFVTTAAAAMARVLVAKREMGRTYSTLDGLGRVVFVHPDGIARETREPGSVVVAL